MARSGALKVMEFNLAANAGRILVASTGIDTSDSSADAGIIAVPVDMIIYQFGVYVMEALGVASVGDVVLETINQTSGGASTLPTSGTATARATIDLDSTDLASGNGTSAAVTASTGSEDIEAGDVIFAPASSFPLFIPAPHILTVRHVQTSSVAGELAPFIVCRWLTPDLRMSSQWMSNVTT